jgi:hypothetical protein
MNFNAAVATRPSSINRVQQPLTIDAVRRYAPSAFAVEPHESRSSRYAYIPTSDVLAQLMHEGFQPFYATQSTTRVEGKQNFTKHLIRLRHVSNSIARQVGDTVAEVALVNAHDGSASFWLLEAMFRLTCENGMFVDNGGGQTLKINHTGNIIDRVIEGSFAIIERSVKALDVVNDWSRLQLTNGEQQAFAAAAHSLRFADSEGATSTPITPAQLLSPRRREDSASANGFRVVEGIHSDRVAAPDLWRTLNVVQENVIKGGLNGVATSRDERGRMSRRHVTTRQVKGIDQDVKLNRALWTLATEMAKLKSAAAVA